MDQGSEISGGQPTPEQRLSHQGPGVFPDIVHCEWSILDPPSPTASFNCIAWSVGEYTHPYSEIDIDQDYGNTDGIFTDEDMDSFFDDKGYNLFKVTSSPTESDAEAADIMYYPYPHAWNYENGDPRPAYGCHAAKRKNCSCGAGKWVMYESKIGNGGWDIPIIEHVWNQLNNNNCFYGKPKRFYKEK